MKKVSDLILIGSGRHSHACIDVIEQCGTHKICGLVGLAEEVGKYVCGYPVLGSDANLEGMKKAWFDGICLFRADKVSFGTAQGFRLSQAIRI